MKYIVKSREVRQKSLHSVYQLGNQYPHEKQFRKRTEQRLDEHLNKRQKMWIEMRIDYPFLQVSLGKNKCRH